MASGDSPERPSGPGCRPVADTFARGPSDLGGVALRCWEGGASRWHFRAQRAGPRMWARRRPAGEAWEPRSCLCGLPPSSPAKPAGCLCSPNPSLDWDCPGLGSAPQALPRSSQPLRLPGEEDLLESASREPAPGYRILVKERVEDPDYRRCTGNRGFESTKVLGWSWGMEQIGVEREKLRMGESHTPGGKTSLCRNRDRESREN